MTLYADDILKKKETKAPTGTLTEITKGTLSGALIGFVGGTLFAYFRKKPYLKCMVIGTFAGGVVSRIFLIKK